MKALVAASCLASLLALTLVQPASGRRFSGDGGRSMLDGATIVMPAGLRPNTPPWKIAVLIAGLGQPERLETLTLLRTGSDP